MSPSKTVGLFMISQEEIGVCLVWDESHPKRSYLCYREALEYLDKGI